MADRETSGAVLSALVRFAIVFVALKAVFALLAVVAGGALPGTTIIILAIATVMARRKFHALRLRRPNDLERILLLFGAFLIAMVAASAIGIVVAVAQAYPDQSASKTIGELLRARPIDVLIVRYLLGGLAYFLIIWVSYGPLLESFAIPPRTPGNDDDQP
jgi:hypothetical protein